MRKRNVFVIVIGVILVISFYIVVCVQAEAQEILNVGATLPYHNRMGIQTKNILLMNADLLNKSGGLKVGEKHIRLSIMFMMINMRLMQGEPVLKS